MSDSGDLDFERLLDWIEGRLTDEEAEKVSAQVAEAGDVVHDELSWLRRFYEASEELILAEPPAQVTEELEWRFARYAQRRRRANSLHRLRARLRFDSHVEFARGMRTTGATEDTRQLVYTAESITVICTVQHLESGKRLVVWGQVLPAGGAEPSSMGVALLKNQKEFDRTITDELGEFTLAAIPRGLYDLILSSEQYEITIEALDLTL